MKQIAQGSGASPSQTVCKSCLQIQFSQGPVCVGLMIGLVDLKGLLHSRHLCDSVTSWKATNWMSGPLGGYKIGLMITLKV